MSRPRHVLSFRHRFYSSIGHASPHPKPSQLSSARYFLDDLVYGLRHIIHIAAIQPGHADAAVLGHVDMGVRAEPQDLGLAQPREAEHADLIRDVAPAALAAVQLLQLAPQRRTHILDPSAHGAQVGLPFGEQLLVVQHRAGDAGAICWRVADLAALQNGELRGDVGDCLRGVGPGGGDEVKGAGALTVEPEILGEGLCHAELESFRDKVPHRPGVVFQTARCETLVGAVEEGKVFFRADELRELGPLGSGEINPRWIMGTGMQQYDAARLSLLNCGTHASEIQAFCFRGKIGVRLRREIDIGEDLVMIGPCGRGEIDCLV